MAADFADSECEASEIRQQCAGIEYLCTVTPLYTYIKI